MTITSKIISTLESGLNRAQKTGSTNAFYMRRLVLEFRAKHALSDSARFSHDSLHAATGIEPTLVGEFCIAVIDRMFFYLNNGNAVTDAIAKKIVDECHIYLESEGGDVDLETIISVVGILANSLEVCPFIHYVKHDATSRWSEPVGTRKGHFDEFCDVVSEVGIEGYESLM